MSKKNRKKGGARSSTAIIKEPIILDRWSDRTKHLVAIGVLLLTSLAFFAKFHFDGKAVAPTDSVGWRASAESIVAYQDSTGQRALWATNMFAGMPAYMISYAPRSFQLDTIARWMRNFIWPSSHFIFALIGMYLLGFLVTREWIASTLAAIAYGLTTYLPILIMAGHNSKFISLCFAPWLVVSFLYVLRKPGILATLLFAASAAVNLRAGHIQITYFFVVAILVLWIGALVHAYREGELRAFVVSTLYLAFGSVLALLMVAQPYLANAEYKALSIRGASVDPSAAGGLGWERAMLWSQGRAELLTLVISNAFGGSSLYWGPKTFTGGPHYFGGITVVLAIVAVLRRRDWLVRSFAVVVLLLIGFSLGENFAILNKPAYNWLPLFSSFRAPETWLAAVAAFVAVLAAIGLVELGSLLRNGEKMDRRVVGPWLGMVGIVLVLMLGKTSFFSFEKEGEVDRIAAQIARSQQVQMNDPRVAQAAEQYVVQFQSQRIEAFQKDAMRTLLLLLLAGALVYAVSSRARLASLATISIVLLVLLDLFGVGRRYIGDDVLVDSKDLTTQIPKYDFDDFIIDRVKEAGGPGHFRVLSLEGEPTTNARPSYYYESIGGYHGAKLRVFEDFLENVLFHSGRGTGGTSGFDILNVRYVVGRQAMPGWTPVYQSQQTGLTVFRNDSDPGRAFFVDRFMSVTPGTETWERVRAPEFDPTQTAIVTPDVGEFLTTRVQPVDSTSSASVRMTEFGPRLIEWEVETSASRILVVSEIFYPKGWHATVDGEEADIFLVDGVLRGLVVPEGAHTVQMRFDPASDRVGGLISATSSAFVYVGIVVLLFMSYRRRQTEVADEESAG